jgi:adenylate cyclase
MLINFMGYPSFATPGARQTFPIRSYSGYASRPTGPDPSTWPKTKAVGNKLLMVGPFARGMAADQKTTPYGLMYGVEIHANSLNTILMNNFLRKVPMWVDFLVFFVLIMFTAFMTSRLSTVLSLVLSLVIIFVFFIAVTFVFDEQAYLINFSTVAIGIFFTFLTNVVYRIMTEERDKARIRNMFGKYVSPKVVDQILEDPPELGGIDKELTVCFSDIRGFTTLSESLTPQELVNHLNIYLTAMTDIILDYSGTLDKYVGDEIMWFFGAPLPQEDHALIACKCALKQMDTLRQLNAEWPPEKRINIGIGVNTGIMTVGNMGSSGRMNYTLMGDNVNLGARLEGTNKQYLTNVIISEYTYGLVKDKIIARELDNIRVKGKNKPVLIYELVDCVEGYDIPKKDNGS